MKINDLTDLLMERFPIYLQEKYDNSGEQVIFGDRKIEGVLLSLDIDKDVIQEASETKANLIITHHPFFFRALKRVKSGEPESELLLSLIDKKISLYSAHTNLDKIYFDKLGEVLGVKKGKLLLKTNELAASNQEYGFGVIGELSKKRSLNEIMKEVKDKLSLDFLLYSGDGDARISKIALVGGAGGNQVERILKEHTIELIITGDIGYHPWKIARDYGVQVIDATHYGTERILLNFLKDEIEDCLTKFKDTNHVHVRISRKEENPFKVYM